MKHFEVFLAVMLLPLPVLAADHAIPARVSVSKFSSTAPSCSSVAA